MEIRPYTIPGESLPALIGVDDGTVERPYVPKAELVEALESADKYRRQLGGTNAALNRARQRCRDLEELCRSLWWQGEHCPEFGSQRCMRDYERRMHELGLLEGVD